MNREELLAKIDALQDEIIRLNEAACRKDFEAGGLTPDEFARLPEVRAKEEAMKRLDGLCEILEKFYQLVASTEATPTWVKEVLY